MPNKIEEKKLLKVKVPKKLLSIFTNVRKTALDKLSFLCVISGILPSNWRRYTVPKGLTVLQWVADFSDRIKQLQKISHAANTGGAKGLKVSFSEIQPKTKKIIILACPKDETKPLG